MTRDDLKPLVWQLVGIILGGSLAIGLANLLHVGDDLGRVCFALLGSIIGQSTAAILVLRRQ